MSHAPAAGSPPGTAETRSSSAAGGTGDKQGLLNRDLILGILGASAGITFSFYVIGAVVEYRRYETLELPGTQTVAPLAEDSLVALGARHLAPPALGAAGTAALYLLLVAIGRDRSRLSVALVTATLAAITATAFGIKLLGGVGTYENVAVVLLIEVVALLGWIASTSDSERIGTWWPSRHSLAAGILALGVAAVAATFVIVHVWRAPVDLEHARVDLREGRDLCGIYLALTDAYLYIAPASKQHDGYHTHRRVVALPLADVKSFELSRKQHVWPGDAPPVERRLTAGCP